MRFYVPELGDSIRLTSDWTFTLYSENRNSDFAARLGKSGTQWSPVWSYYRGSSKKNIELSIKEFNDGGWDVTEIEETDE